MNIKNGMRPVHPGEILCEELETLGLSDNELAKALDVSPDCITAILNGQRDVTADIALRLARYFGTTPQVWLNLAEDLRTVPSRDRGGPAHRRARETSANNGVESDYTLWTSSLTQPSRSLLPATSRRY